MVAFEFNTSDVFLGRINDEAVEAGETLIFPDFLATPFIEAQPSHVGLIKVSGPCGEPPQLDHRFQKLVDTVQCFIHFTIVKSQQTLMFADLQGE